MSKEKLVYKLQRRDGLICGICHQDISKEVERYHLMHRFRRTSPREREELGLKRIKRRDINLNIDHVVPTSRGGDNDISNKVLAHATCNTEKGNLLLEELYGDIPFQRNTRGIHSVKK